MTHQEPICVTSYNTTGFNISVQNFLTTLALFSNIICIQEHFLLDSKDKNYSNTNKIRKIHGCSHDMFITQLSRKTNKLAGVGERGA